MKIVVTQNKDEKYAIAQKNGEVNDKDRDRYPVVNCLWAREASQQEGSSTVVGPHGRFYKWRRAFSGDLTFKYLA